MTVEFGKNLDSSSVKATAASSYLPALPFPTTADNFPEGLDNSMQNICQLRVTVQYTAMIPKAGELLFTSQIEMGWCGQANGTFCCHLVASVMP